MPLRAVLLFLMAGVCSVSAQTGCMNVSVIDYKGLPLAHLKALVSRGYIGEYWNSETDAKGHFSLPALPPGNYIVTLRNQDLGYPDTINFDFTGVVHQPEYTVTESATCIAVNVQREPPAGRLHLKLTDEETGKFIEEPEAQFRRTDGHHAWNATTHREQDILIPPLKPVEVRVGAKGYRTTAPFTLQPMQPGEVRDFTAVLKPIGLGCLHGRVFDADGQPVIGIKVQPLLLNDNVNSKALFVDTNGDGEFEIADLPTGHYQVTVHSKEMSYDSSSMVKKDGRFPEIDVSASPACAEIMVNLTAPNGKLVIEVVDARTHAPVERFKYTVKSAVSRPWWYSEGREAIREIQIPPGQACNLTAESEGYARSDVMPLAPFKSGEVRKVTIALQPLHEGGK